MDKVVGGYISMCRGIKLKLVLMVKVKGRGGG